MEFEKLEIRIIAREVTNKFAKIFYNQKFKNYSFQDQIMRACISV